MSLLLLRIVGAVAKLAEVFDSEFHVFPLVLENKRGLARSALEHIVSLAACGFEALHYS